MRSPLCTCAIRASHGICWRSISSPPLRFASARLFLSILFPIAALLSPPLAPIAWVTTASAQEHATNEPNQESADDESADPTGSDAMNGDATDREESQVEESQVEETQGEGSNIVVTESGGRTMEAKSADDKPSQAAAVKVQRLGMLSYDRPANSRWRVGTKINTGASPFMNVHVTVPVPMDWPEQTVKVALEDVDTGIANYQLRKLDEGVQQVVIDFPSIAPGQEVMAMWEFEVVRQRILGPEDPSALRIPKNARDNKQLRDFLGDSPFIKSSHSKVRKIAKETFAIEATNDWERIEHLYDWVRDNIEYKQGPIRTAVEALDDKWGDCEELTSLFIAMCRSKGVPARMVWIPDHCYPEFYLEDEAGKGYWFPCQLAGTRQFGDMDETRPVLQKGDRFKVPEKKKVQRYVAEFISGTARGNGSPEVTFVRELMDK
jgi:hypothetical protein